MTHEHIKSLDELIEVVEAGDLTDVNRKLGAMFAADHSLAWDWVSNVNSAFRGSLDAAKALHEALLPGWFPGMSQNIHYGHWYVWVQAKATLKHFSAEDDSPARAWLIAILKAYRAQMEAS